MQTVLTPFLRSSAGFDQFNNWLESAFGDNVSTDACFAYDIEKHSEDKYRITMAVPGFKPENLDITVQDNQLIVTGKIEKKEEVKDSNVKYLHKGITSKASFRRSFSLTSHMKVESASMVDGLLKVDLVCELPEAQKPKSIQIRTGPETNASAISGSREKQKVVN